MSPVNDKAYDKAYDALAIQLPLLTEPIQSIFEHGSRRSLGTIRVRQSEGGVVETPTYVRLGGLVLCHLFPAPEEGSALTVEGTVLGRVSTVRQAEGLSAHLLRWNWAYCADGVGCLAERLDSLLGIANGDVARERLYRLSSGGLYSFVDHGETRAAGLATRLRDTVEQIDGGATGRPLQEEFERPPLERLRSHERIGVTIPCLFKVGEQNIVARIYNISREGIFVACADEMPEEKERLDMAIAVQTGAERYRIVFSGKVQWRIDSPGGSGGGFGLAVETVQDSRDGAVFHAFLDDLIRKHIGRLPRSAGGPEIQIKVVEPTEFAA